MKTGVQITIIVTILIAVLTFAFTQSDQLSRHDVRIDNLEDNYDEVKEMRKDISDIKATLARLAAIMEQTLRREK